MKLKGQDGQEYTGEIKGGAFAVSDAKGNNVNNFKNEADAIKLGGFEIIAENVASQPEAGSQGKPPEGGQIGADPKAGTQPQTGSQPPTAAGNGKTAGEQPGQPAAGSDKGTEKTAA